MKRATAFCGLLLASLPAFASTEQVNVNDIVAATGLSPSEVQMVLGARTTHMEYFTSFERAQRRMIQVLGMQRYRDLTAGRDIVLDSGKRLSAR